MVKEKRNKIMLLFIPREIKVGYQKRDDTYSKKLAYVIYIDEKGKLRKENSWESWRSKKIDPDKFDNIPTEGFVLNKKVGDYHYGHPWEHRHAHIRIYDPRGFEFEISVQNLLYILENTNSFKGKGLDGEFVYGWNQSDLILIPIAAPEHKEYKEFSDNKYNAINNKIGARDLILGGLYLTKDNKEIVYMGKNPYYEYDWDYKEIIGNKKRFFFCKEENNYITTITYTSIPGNIIKCILDKCVNYYSELFDILNKQPYYTKIDYTKTELKEFTLEEFKDWCSRSWWAHFISNINGTESRFETSTREKSPIKVTGRRWKNIGEYESIEEVYKKYKPSYKQLYLANGEKLERKIVS